jgi:hypothetical protein
MLMGTLSSATSTNFNGQSHSFKFQPEEKPTERNITTDVVSSNLDQGEVYNIM